MCHEYVEELEPSIRYYLHKIRESNLQTSEPLQIGEMEGLALDRFKSKLEAVMAKANASTSMLSRTHGQPASPTTVRKEMTVFAVRLRRESCLSHVGREI